MDDDLEDMEGVLNFGLQKLGYSKLRDGQKRVVEAFLTGKDVFFCSPTGDRASRCALRLPRLSLRELQWESITQKSKGIYPPFVLWWPLSCH